MASNVNLASVLNITRAICTVDCESTGIDPQNDRIIQIAITMHRPGKDPVAWQSLVNPIIPIPPEATAVHHITDADVAHANTFRTMAPKLAHALSNVDFAGFNVSYDLKLLQAEFNRADIKWTYEGACIIDAHRIYRILHPRDLSSAHLEFAGGPIEGAHDAAADVAATERVLAGQLTLYPEIPRDIRQLHDYCWPKAADAVDSQRKFMWRGNHACISFGKHQGTPIHMMDKGYLRWMMNGDFSAEVKRICEDALSGVYPQLDKK